MSNAKVVKISKLVNDVNINLKKYDPAEVSIKEYDPSKVAIDLDNSKASFNEYELPTNIALGSGEAAVPDTNFTHLIRGNNAGISKLCTPCVGSKSIQIVKQDENMTLIIDKLEEVHTDLWGPHNLPSQFKSMYTVILRCKHKQKTWTIYL